MYAIRSYYGSVRDNKGTPLYGATVKIQDSQDYSTTTDTKGRFYINTDKVIGNT